jgi:hypothetical protein
MGSFREWLCDVTALVGAVAIGAGLARWGWEFAALWGGAFALVSSVLAARARVLTRVKQQD